MSMLVDEKAQSGDLRPSASPYCLMDLTFADLTPPSACQAPQSLRRLFHDESSAEPDPFGCFAHQQPPTPQTSEGSSSVEQVGRFNSPPEEEFLEDTGSSAFDAPTIRQNPHKALSIDTSSSIPPPLSSSPSSAIFLPEKSQAPTPIARFDSSTQAIPSPRQIKGKMSFDTVSSAPTSRSQPEVPRKDSFTGRKPGGSVSEGLKGFQFPLVTQSSPVNPITPARPHPPALHRMHSAAATTPLPSDPPSRQVPSQLSLVPPARPPMMRQASVAVMEGRAQSQAQALALAQAQAQDSPLSPTKNLALPRPGMGGAAVMMRSRSGSRVDAEGLAGGMGLRDLLKVWISLLHSWDGS